MNNNISKLGLSNLNHIRLPIKSYNKKSAKHIDNISTNNYPMTYFKCGKCNSLEIESCKCNSSNYKCKKCNWTYITHNHEMKMIQNSLNFNNISQQSILMKAIKK